MSWKTDIKLDDLDPTSRIEITCKRCGHSHVLSRDDLLKRGAEARNSLDEVESALLCRKRICRGSVRIALIHAHKMEGFVGGMA